MKAKLSVKGFAIPFSGSNPYWTLGCLLSLLLLTTATPAHTQTSPLTFTPIPYDDPDIISPGRGAEQWHNAVGSIAYPTGDNPQQSLDVYYRFTWNDFEGATQGSYDWSDFDSEIREVINKGQKFSFGIMSCYPWGHGDGVVVYDNGDAAYPEYLHNLMQTETYKDWKTTGSGPTDGYGSWVPNWNSPYYLARLSALHEALYAHIKSASYTAVEGPHKGKSIAYNDVISSIDIRGYGSWGEWHAAGIVNEVFDYPTGTRPTAATLKTIIDHHVNVFTDHPLSVMISTFDGERYPNQYIPKEVSAHALAISNNWGKLGWRRDNWGATDSYIEALLKGNTVSYGSSGPFNAIIMERWKYAPVTGETAPWLPSLNGCGFDDLERQVREYHATSFGNGNYGNDNPPGCAQENIRAAFKATGYRIVLEGGSISSSIRPGGNLAITLNWKNIGLTPTYEKWDVFFELKNNDGATVWSGASQFSPGAKGSSLALLPSSQASLSNDHFTLPSTIAEGNYDLHVIIKDPTGYRAPLPLAIDGRNADGSYTLKNITVDETGTIPPTDTIPPIDSIPPVEDCSTTTATISNTPNCNNQGFDLILASADGAGPFDVTINGTTYNNIPVGGIITSIGAGGGGESIWSSTPAPKTYEDSPVELGLKFISSSAGVVRGLRFFSANNVGGEYTGHLWDASGNLLASATFSNVTVNGWQEVLFSEPVAIAPGVVYIASYYNPAGVYAATSGGLTAAVSNGQSLTALGNDAPGGNGIYSYSSDFPTNTFNASNYWVDVLFDKGGTSAFNLTSVTGSDGCNSTGLLQTLTVSSSDCAQAERAAAAGSSVMAAPAENKKQESTIFKDELGQNYPNPFRNETIINYSLAKQTKVNLSLFDMNGRLVKILVSGTKEAGSHTVRVNAGSIPAGIYFYKLHTSNYSGTKRLIIQY